MARSYPLDINVTQNLGQSPKARKALHNDPDEKVYHDFSDQDKNVLEEACDSLGDVFECHLIVRDHIKSSAGKLAARSAVMAPVSNPEAMGE